jgi:EAL domain-containing protein (putative c-di-GMP-specific phosphodiesterase class I)
MAAQSPAASSKDELESTVETESIFQRFREALPSVPLHNVTMHDAKGELLWGSQRRNADNLGQALRDALDAFGLGCYPYLEFPLEGERSAIMLPARSPDGTLAAVAALVIDTAMLDRRIDSCGTFLTPEVRAALKAIGASLTGQEWPAPKPAAPAPPTSGVAVDAMLDAPPSIAVPEGRKRTAASAPATAPAPAPAPKASKAPPTPAGKVCPVDVSPEVDRMFAAIRDEAIVLHVQPLVRLRSSARTRRYEVLLRSRSDHTSAPVALLKAAAEHGLDSMLDRRVISQLMAWLVQRRDQWKVEAPMFSINLSATSLGEDHFFKFVDLCVKKASLPAGIIGFEITESSCRADLEAARRALAAFHGLGCPVVLDDFSMHTDVLPLLAEPGIRLVKIDPQLTTGALGDKMREARVVSIVQGMRVLGMHTVAKRVEDETERDWLTALGVDFVQSFRFMPPEPLDEFSDSRAEGPQKVRPRKR